MAEIEILIAIDSDTIAATIPPSLDQNNPANVPAGTIYMITSAQNALSGNAGNELNISANTGDIVRWREMSLSLDVDDRVLLYNFIGNNNTLITPPQPIIIQISDTLPGTPPNILPPTMQTINDYFWQTTVLAAGTDTYHFYFMLTKRNGTLVGYYQWDPFITITS